MIATLEFVARSDWVTILPSVISVNDIGRGELIVNPIVEPELHAEFVVIQPTRRTLSTQARHVPGALRSRSRTYSRRVGRSDRWTCNAQSVGLIISARDPLRREHVHCR